jgi:drug/metabolite transporter (DMT)-like permease
MMFGIAGLAILGINPAESLGIGVGDSLTVLASFAFAFFILSLDRLGRTVNSADLLPMLVAATGLPTLFLSVGVAAGEGKLVDWWEWLLEILRQPAVIRDVLLLTLLSTILATYLMSTYQPRLSASRAALIYLLEPVFAASLSVLLGHDSVTARLFLGGALILCGNACVDLPIWLRDLRAMTNRDRRTTKDSL